VKLRLRPAAEADVAEAIRWYEEQAPGLGDRFLHSFEATLQRIAKNPRLYPEVLLRARRALFPRPFPYMVLYTIDEATISAYAVIHQARHPDRWKPRD
jgi:plasmid stabilization system protein ParE